MAAGKRLGQLRASAADARPELFVGIEFGHTTSDRDSVPAAGLHRRPYPLGDGARLGPRDSRQYEEQLIAAPVDGKVGLAYRPDERLGDTPQQFIFNASIG